MSHHDYHAAGRIMPDLSDHAVSGAARRVSWVGMRGIELPLSLRDPAGRQFEVPARVDCGVDLADPGQRGIHMSRLYLKLAEALPRRPLSPAMIDALLAELLDTQKALSTRVELALAFDRMLERPALVSANRGWRRYPLRLRASRTAAGTIHELGVTLLYSSTCPSSAALARQVAAERFVAEHGRTETVPTRDIADWLRGDHGMPATPHAQRSRADIAVRLAAAGDYPYEALIDDIEQVLATPVQTAVKREDEQAFAVANAANLMFCEDAVRRVASLLDRRADVADFRVQVEHLESLHPHDAVAVDVKGVEGGFRA